MSTAGLSRALLHRGECASTASTSRYCKTLNRHGNEWLVTHRAYVQRGGLYKSGPLPTRRRQATPVPHKHHVCCRSLPQKGSPDGLAEKLKKTVKQKLKDKVVEKLSEPVKLPDKLPGLLNDVQRVVEVFQMANDSFNKFASRNPENNKLELSVDDTLRLFHSEEYPEQFDKLVGLSSREDTPWTDEDVRRWFERIDKDNNGTIRRSEFLVLWLTKMRAFLGTADKRTLALAFFRYLDSDGDGKISASELKRFLPLLAPALHLRIPAKLAISMVKFPDWMEINYVSLLGATMDELEDEDCPDESSDS
mmetsp:Transcript_7617/g.15487  ORF Transcript_7617/g.15487 Transcript_7617/m.15487 type:complete len:307 (+) Transcript_7617:123-1043(+)